MKTDCTCGINYEGSIDSDNIVRIEEDVQTEQDCRRLCTLDRSCLLYTYYNEGHVTDEKLCILLNEMHNPVRTCENCQTGAAICEPFNQCTVAVLDGGDNISMSKLFVSESKTLTFASGEDGCSKTVNGVTMVPVKMEECLVTVVGEVGVVSSMQPSLSSSQI